MPTGTFKKACHQLTHHPRLFFRNLGQLHRFFRRGDARFDDRLNMTVREWLIHHQTEVVFKGCSWFGVPAYKNPTDAWIYQELIYRVKPDTIIEIVSRIGGSTRYFARPDRERRGDLGRHRPVRIRGGASANRDGYGRQRVR